MYERVIENWLTRVNEKSLQGPFCQLLASEGYQVIHLVRHGPTEQGKDILAIAPDGVPCAYQIMSHTGKITLAAWQDYLPQIIRLVEIPITHPSLPRDTSQHRPYLVTNGELAEEVKQEIADRNRGWQLRGLPCLETIVRGQLLTRFQGMQTDLWPVPLSTEKTLLEFFLAEGVECLDKGKLSVFLGDLLSLHKNSLSPDAASRELACAVMWTSYALSPFVEKKNHVAQIEGWMVYIANLVALVEKHKIGEKYWRESLNISVSAIEQIFIDLCTELKERPHLVEGNALMDEPFYRGRVTWLVGLVSVFALWQRVRAPQLPLDSWFKIFVTTHQRSVQLWGEAAIPQLLATLWFLHSTTGSLDPERMLGDLIDTICYLNTDEPTGHGLPDPYCNLGMVIDELYQLNGHSPSYSYRGRSYTLESLIHLFARRNWRQRLRFQWPYITQIEFAEVQAEQSWQYCLWHIEDHATLLNTLPKTPQSWTELRREAAQVNTSLIPLIFRKRPELLLLFVVVYPHRLTKNIAKFLDDELQIIKV